MLLKQGNMDNQAQDRNVGAMERPRSQYLVDPMRKRGRHILTVLLGNRLRMRGQLDHHRIIPSPKSASASAHFKISDSTREGRRTKIPNSLTPRLRAKLSTSLGNPFNVHPGYGSLSPHPGLSTAIILAPTSFAVSSKIAASMRDPGRPCM